MKLRVILLNVWIYALLSLTTVLFAVLFLPIVFFPPAWRYRSRWHQIGASLVGRIFLWSARIKFKIDGFEKIAALDGKPAIIVINHQSAFDAAIVEALFWSQLRISFSNDYPKVPVLGIVLRRMHIVVQRITARSSHQSLDRAVKIAGTYGSHIIIFPEGTRHMDGKIHKFYRGFTILAQELDRPVVPIFLYGMHRVMTKGSCLLNPSKSPVTVLVGEPFIFQPELETREEFLEKIHNWFTLECSKVSHNQ